MALPCKRLNVAVLVAALLLAQGLASLLPLSWKALAHEPLDECAQHECGCDPDVSKRKSCCCYPERNKNATDRTDGPLQVILRAAQCNGAGPAQAAGIAQLDWAGAPPVEAPVEQPPLDIRFSHSASFAQYQSSPLTPPPRSSSVA
jgi:hypothetical protein